MDINTPEGMAEAVAWLKYHLLIRVAENGVWAIPRSRALYQVVSKDRKTYATYGPRDAATDRVLAEAGWTETQPPQTGELS